MTEERKRRSVRAGVSDWNRNHGEKVQNWGRTAIFQYLALFAGFGSFCFLGLSFFEMKDEFQNREEERGAREEERIERAWSNLLRREGGNTGKGKAYSYLLSYGEETFGVNASCSTKNEACFNKTVFANIEIPEDYPLSKYDENSVLDLFTNMNVSFSEIWFDFKHDKNRYWDGIVVERANLKGTYVVYPLGEHAIIESTNVINARFDGAASLAIFDTDLSFVNVGLILKNDLDPIKDEDATLSYLQGRYYFSGTISAASPMVCRFWKQSEASTMFATGAGLLDSNDLWQETACPDLFYDEVAICDVNPGQDSIDPLPGCERFPDRPHAITLDEAGERYPDLWEEAKLSSRISISKLQTGFQFTDFHIIRIKVGVVRNLNSQVRSVEVTLN